MGRPPVEKEAPRLRNGDVVVPKQIKLVEDEQKARGIAAGIDAIKLMDVVHVLGAGAGHVVFRARHRANALIEPGTSRCNGLALRLW